MDQSYIVDSLIKRSKPIKGTGHRFLIARLAKNFSRGVVARQTKIPHERLIKIESCLIEPSQEEIHKLSAALKLSSKQLHRNYPDQ